MEILIIVLILIVADIVAGILASVEYGEYCSEKMRKGLYHKLASVMLLALSFLLQYAVTQLPDLPSELAAIYPGTGIYIIIMETTSLLENLVKMNPDLANNRILQIFTSKVEINTNSDNEDEENRDV